MADIMAPDAASLEVLLAGVEPCSGALASKRFEFDILQRSLKPTGRFRAWLRGDSIKKDNGREFERPTSLTRALELDVSMLLDATWLDWGDDEEPPTPTEEKLARETQAKWSGVDEGDKLVGWGASGRAKGGASAELIATDLLSSGDDDAEQLAVALLLHAHRGFLFALAEARGTAQAAFMNAANLFLRPKDGADPDFEPLRDLLGLDLAPPLED
ncbi:hypothetical protein M885DRAFT_531262 [Pelagophyceae sp. CCMP2097]|nr:hypothetical protein M885DRAFT_531262 [Pelagophyceae sp. CCMP2097]